LLDATFLIVTTRPHEQYARRAIDSINRDFSGSHEILVYCDTNIKGKFVTWHKEFKKKGPIFAFNFMAKKANGRYIYVCCDDAELRYTDKAIEKIESLPSGWLRMAGMKHHGHYEVRLKEIDAILIGNPVVRQDTLQKELGGQLFNGAYYYYHADNWLTYWAARRGTPIPMSDTELCIFDSKTGGNAGAAETDGSIYQEMVMRYDGKYHTG